MFLKMIFFLLTKQLDCWWRHRITTHLKKKTELGLISINYSLLLAAVKNAKTNFTQKYKVFVLELEWVAANGEEGRSLKPERAWSSKVLMQLSFDRSITRFQQKRTKLKLIAIKLLKTFALITVRMENLSSAFLKCCSTLLVLLNTVDGSSYTYLGKWLKRFIREPDTKLKDKGLSFQMKNCKYIKI